MTQKFPLLFRVYSPQGGSWASAGGCLYPQGAVGQSPDQPCCLHLLFHQTPNSTQPDLDWIYRINFENGFLQTMIIYQIFARNERLDAFLDYLRDCKSLTVYPVETDDLQQLGQCDGQRGDGEIYLSLNNTSFCITRRYLL